MKSEASRGASRPSPIEALVGFCVDAKPAIFLALLLLVGWGLITAPFDWKIPGLTRDPVPVDAIPDLGENQQIVFTDWSGRSPQDVEDQVTYPLTVALLGVPEVKTIRSSSNLGFSTIYVIFNEGIDFHWARTRVLERLASLTVDTLPEGVQPRLGPDATALGQVFWYTLEGLDADGEPTGGWGPEELRVIQDWTVRYALMTADGVSEVASIGGFVPEYQVDVDPDAMSAHGVRLDEVFHALRNSNVDVGARTIEINRVEYVIRGLGFLRTIADIEATVVRTRDNVPISVRDVAHVSMGPGLRRGALDKDGSEAVGGVVVARYGANPLAVIESVKAKIAEISGGLPAKVLIDWRNVDRAEVEAYARELGFAAFTTSGLDQEAWVTYLRAHPASAADRPAWLRFSEVRVVPFYDRSGLILETLETLESALTLEVLVTLVVILVMVMHLTAALLVSALLPIAVLFCFIAMRVFGVDANIVALSGIAIAIGTMVDMGVILVENLERRSLDADPGADRRALVLSSTREVGGAVLTAVATTVLGFLPVFWMTGAEGKLFKPLAFTKTFALLAAAALALTVLPAAAHLVLGRGRRRSAPPDGEVRGRKRLPSWVVFATLVGALLVLLAREWAPLGVGAGRAKNLIFVAVTTLGLLLFFALVRRGYERTLRFCLDHKLFALSVPVTLVAAATFAWLGFERTLAPLPGVVEQLGGNPDRVRSARFWVGGARAFPGFGTEFMPPLDEGSFLFMPSTMPHASIGESREVLAQQDRAISSIPEVDSVVGKLGRVESALDPAPIAMVETVVTYLPEYSVDEGGETVRNWRPHIQSPDDIWKEIVDAGSLVGSTSATRLQPIATRLVMLQTGMRSNMGIKVKGPDLETIERVGIELEQLLQEVSGVEPGSIFADRIVGKPYLEIDLDREALARYGLPIRAAQDVIEVAVGGRRVTTTVEGRERYDVRVRYARELRDTLESLERILVPTPEGAQVPLGEVAEIRYVRGPQAIKSEGTSLVGYVVFDKVQGTADVDVIESCRRHLETALASGAWSLPPGVSYAFTGTWENQVRSQATLRIVLPLALGLILIVLYLHFRSMLTSALVFSGIFVAWSGGFLLLWLYGQPWFLDFEVFGRNLRDVFQVAPIDLSVAVWVGFLALFGIASDDGVVMATMLDQNFAERQPQSTPEIRSATIEAGLRRVRPCLMTTATTLIALLPVLTSPGRGSDVMVPMAIPTFGGMMIAVLSMFVVPVLYCFFAEVRAGRKRESA